VVVPASRASFSSPPRWGAPALSDPETRHCLRRFGLLRWLLLLSVPGILALTVVLILAAEAETPPGSPLLNGPFWNALAVAAFAVAFLSPVLAFIAFLLLWQCVVIRRVLERGPWEPARATISGGESLELPTYLDLDRDEQARERYVFGWHAPWRWQHLDGVTEVLVSGIPGRYIVVRSRERPLLFIARRR
jgi:hypothetical protein